MKNPSFTVLPLSQKFITYLAATVTVAMVIFGAALCLQRANARGNDHHSDEGRRDAELLLHLYDKAQVAEIDDLLAGFHGALSYGGDIDSMMSLWADNSTFTLNGASFSGKAAIQANFLAGGYFHNNWVSLAPEYKTVVTIHGDNATAVTQCVAIDLSVSPNVVKSVIQVNATIVKHNGKWLFTSMNNTTPAPL